MVPKTASCHTQSAMWYKKNLVLLVPPPSKNNNWSFGERKRKEKLRGVALQLCRRSPAHAAADRWRTSSSRRTRHLGDELLEVLADFPFCFCGLGLYKGLATRPLRDYVWTFLSRVLLGKLRGKFARGSKCLLVQVRLGMLKIWLSRWVGWFCFGQRIFFPSELGAWDVGKDSGRTADWLPAEAKKAPKAQRVHDATCLQWAALKALHKRLRFSPLKVKALHVKALLVGDTPL